MNEKKKPQRIDILLSVYGNRTASADEIRELFQLLDETGGEEKLKAAVLGSLNATKETAAGRPEDRTPPMSIDRIWKGVRSALQHRRRRSLKRIAIAAAAGLVLFAAVAELAPEKRGRRGWLKADVAVGSKKSKPDVEPGTTKAVLTLASGEKIWLDSARNGSLAEQGNTEVMKPARGQLLYTVSGTAFGNQLYNSVETPRGGQYQVRLPDGTQVWLNASSSLRFPTFFSGPDRRVELTGEAYFEVAKNANRPFHVLIGQTDIKVLGTHFNVMGYANENMLRTTLLEGRVDVTASGQTKKLLPGKEAIVNAGADSVEVATGNVEQAVAWKNGLFRFHETGIRAIMRQVERWYDVEVEFRTEAQDQDFTGVISRAEHLSALLQTLELTGTVHFRIAGKKVIVLP